MECCRHHRSTLDIYRSGARRLDFYGHAVGRRADSTRRNAARDHRGSRSGRGFLRSMSAIQRFGRIFRRPAILLRGLILCIPLAAPAADDYRHRVEQVLLQTPLIDGHNDLPWEIRDRFKSDVAAVDLNSDTRRLPVGADQTPLMTDIPRLRAGMVGAQFWSVWIPVSVQGFEAVQMTLEQMDLVKRMAAQYPKDFEMAYTAADIRRIHKAHKIASLIGIEGGHQINNSLAVLRQMYAAGARYMTLTHTTNTAWADSATDAPAHNGQIGR